MIRIILVVEPTRYESMDQFPRVDLRIFNFRYIKFLNIITKSCDHCPKTMPWFLTCSPSFRERDDALRRSSWVSVQFLWEQDGLIWGEFCFYRRAHTSCWSVSQVHLIGSTWLLLALVTPMKAVRVYWDRRLLTTFHKYVHVSLFFFFYCSSRTWCDVSPLTFL